MAIDLKELEADIKNGCLQDADETLTLITEYRRLVAALENARNDFFDHNPPDESAYRITEALTETRARIKDEG